MSLLSLRNVSLSFGGYPLISGASLHIDRGERVCLLGRNGAGKSTLLRIIGGELRPDSGELDRQVGLKSAMLPQVVPVDLKGSVREIVARGLGPSPLEAGAGDPVETVASRLSLPLCAQFESLSGGMRRRVLLGEALVGEPDLLLLDEPTNHLDIDSIRWLEELLLRTSSTVLFVSHDRALVERLSTRIVELDRGSLRSYPGSFSKYSEKREAELEAEERQWAAADKKLAEEETWLRQGIKARRTRNEGRVRALLALRESNQARRATTGQVSMAIGAAERSGKIVLEAKDAAFSYGAQKVIQGLRLIVQRGDKIGIIGPNGCGKTTLLQLLTGQLEPTEGTIRHGTRLEVVYLDQLRGQLDENRSVQDNIADGNDRVTVAGKTKHVLGYLRDFLFDAERARTPVSVLSGGERNRLLLARLFTRPSNLLVFDEPTNDLDMDTLELLEERLVAYEGTVVVVSHDRTFLDNVVSSTLAYEGDGRFAEYAGGYSDCEKQRADVRTLPSPSQAPKEKPKRDKPPQQRRLTFKEKQELAELPCLIERLEQEQARLHEAMALPEFYGRESAHIAADVARLDTLPKELEASYARWAELEEIAQGMG
ncbi:MAG: ATP-binding cassette domain-containing protein [Myxococcota bacterium]|nr:ATP-binding cassette domain-containing protein [Myxococcota bacterium]